MSKNGYFSVGQAHLFFNELMDNSVDSIYFKDEKFRFIAVNKNKAERHGVLDPSEMSGKTDFDFIEHQDAQKILEDEKNIFATGEPVVDKVEKMIWKDGSVKWAASSKYPLYDENGKKIGIWGISRDITEQKKIQLSLEASEEKFKTLFEESPVSIIIHDKDTGGVVDANPTAYKEYGLSSLDELKKRDIWLEEPYSGKDALDLIRKASKEGSQTFEWKSAKADGSVFWEHVRLTPIVVDKEERVMAISINITEIKKMEKIIRNEKEQFRTTLLSVGDGVISTDKRGRINIINHVALQLTGWTKEEAKGRPLEEVFNIVNEYTGKKCKNPVEEVLSTGKVVELANHTMLISRDGKQIPIEDSAAPIRDEQGNITGVVLVFRDFTDKKKKQEKIEFLSYRDQLTGLHNRRFLDREIKKMDKKENLPITAVVGDVNGLKLLNDSFGHSEGDVLLKKVADVLRKVGRKDDIIARVGGDEFVMVLPKTDSEKTERIIKRIDALTKKEKIGSIEISVSFGYKTKHDEKTEIQEAMIEAENYMYKKKLFESPGMRGRTISTILNTLYDKDPWEKSHSKNVSKLCKSLGEKLGLGEQDIYDLAAIGLIHDIGKISVDEKILRKTGELTEEEFREIKRHTETGYRILSGVNDMADMADYVLYHHERWDGKGYPRGLKGEEIPYISRIIAVVDSYEAMTSYRCYNEMMDEQEALQELEKCAGTQFDPEIARVFIQMIESKFELNEN